MKFPQISYTHESTDDAKTVKVYGHIVIADAITANVRKTAEAEYQLQHTLYSRIYNPVLLELDDVLKTFSSDPTGALTKLQNLKSILHSLIS